MSRTSRKKIGTRNDEVDKHNDYRVGLYARLSGERTEIDRNKSSSIESQIKMGEEFAFQNGLKITSVYKDYIESGRNFSRIGYLKLLSDVKAGKINCIIVRDLSRLGRDYLEMGRLIETVFPFLGVRFISILDNLDTEKSQDMNTSFEVAIKNIVNDYYSKDVSEKLRRSYQLGFSQGKCMIRRAPYGYKFEKSKNARKLHIDESVRDVVKFIFFQSFAGIGRKKIAIELNRRRISPPDIYRKTKKVYLELDEKSGWKSETINRILKNKIYVGDLIQGKNITDLYRNGKSLSDTVYKVSSHHEPIISKEIFDSVNNRRLISKQCLRNSEGDNKYKGLIYSAISKEYLVRKNESKTEKKSFVYFDSNSKCTPNYYKKVRISESKLDEIVQSVLVELLKCPNLNDKYQNSLRNQLKAQISNLKRSIRKYDIQISAAKKMINNNYENYALGGVNLEKFLNNKNQIKLQIENLLQKKAAIESKIDELSIKVETFEIWCGCLEDFAKNPIITNRLLKELIEKIEIGENNSINIFFKINIELWAGG
ncbi:recombinase family protein [Streptococcus suis]